jgi:hypothetical protein
MPFDLETFTQTHTVTSLIALATGLIVVFGMLAGSRLNGLTAIYLLTSVATSAGGFGFPFDHFLPSHAISALSLVLLLVAILARYVFHFAGAWRWIYVVSTTLTVYFLVFVAVVQAFMKVPALRALAPTQSEPPFTYVQGGVLIVFIILIIVALRAFHPVGTAQRR